MGKLLIKNKKNLGFLLVFITSFFYGTMPAVTQTCYSLGLSVETTLSTRYVCGLALIWTFIFITKKEIKVTKRELVFLIGIGVLALSCTYSMAASYQYIPGAIASILVFLYVIYVNVIEVLIGREKVYVSRILCLIFVIIGVILIVYTPGNVEGSNVKGLTLAILAGFLYSAMSMGMGAKRVKHISAEVMMGYVMMIPTLAFVLKCLVDGEPLFPSQPEQWIYTSILAIGPGFLSCVCFCAAIKIIGASTAAMINTSEPVVAYFAGIVLMSDKITWNATLGGLIIVVVILILNITERRRGTQNLETNL